jgi:hypothetical protein
MPILAHLTLVEGAIHDITLTSIGRIEQIRPHDSFKRRRWPQTSIPPWR